LRRKQRDHDERVQECEALRESAQMFADLAERLAGRLNTERSVDAAISEADPRVAVAMVQDTLGRVVAELRQLTKALRDVAVNVMSERDGNADGTREGR
jgi:hypothetical protein